MNSYYVLSKARRRRDGTLATTPVAESPNYHRLIDYARAKGIKDYLITEHWLKLSTVSGVSISEQCSRDVLLNVGGEGH